MSGIRELLQMRRAELLHNMEPVEAEAIDLRTRLSKMDATLKEHAREIAEIDRALHALSKERIETSITIKDAILNILAGAPNGATSAEILAALNDRYFEGKLRRTSMSPQLARLKNDDHKIKLRGGKYFLA